MIIVGFIWFFSISELVECYNDWRRYFTSFWNWIDMGSFWLNTIFIGVLNYNVYMGQNIVDITVVRTIGAVAGFVMWIKVFYWMRLFRYTSYFITLIVKSVTDTRYFMIMLLIIYCAYGNFNMII
jgi:hypothetical protein